MEQRDFYADIVALEERVLSDVMQGWRTDLDSFKRDLVALIAAAEEKDVSAILPQVTMMLLALTPPVNMASKAQSGINEAHLLGTEMVAHALNKSVPAVAASSASMDAVQNLDQDVRNAIWQAYSNLQRPLPARGITGVLAAVSPVLNSANNAEVATAWAVSNATNAAVHSLARRLDKKLTWISEPDSCVHCQSYSGVEESDNGFPTDLTFGSKPLKQRGDVLLHPPLHPRCRCLVEVSITPEYQEALKREAIRSILKSVALPSESEKVRIDAAQRLLDQHPQAPKSVIKYAERSVKQYQKKVADKATGKKS